MLGVDERTDFRRASLVSELYSESPGPGGILSTAAAAAAAAKNVGGGKKKSLVTVRPPPIPGMRRQVPKGKFGLIGLGKDSLLILKCLGMNYSLILRAQANLSLKKWTLFLFYLIISPEKKVVSNLRKMGLISAKKKSSGFVILADAKLACVFLCVQKLFFHRWIWSIFWRESGW